MYKVKLIHRQLLVLLVIFLSAYSFSYSQTYILDGQNSSLIVCGTSNLHDWEVIAEKHSGTIVLTQENKLEIIRLNTEAVSESLKSGKGGMDKNTYKALNTKKFKTISFELLQVVELSKSASDKYDVKTMGNLTIAGVTKKISLDFNLTVSDSKIHIIGEKVLKMTDYDIEPPKALFGTITTGDDVTIKFNTLLIKK